MIIIIVINNNTFNFTELFPEAKKAFQEYNAKGNNDTQQKNAQKRADYTLKVVLKRQL